MATELKVLKSANAVAPYCDSWAELAAGEMLYVPPFSELVSAISRPDANFRFMVAEKDGRPIALACFLLWRGERTFWLSRIRLFRLRVPMAGLFGHIVVGNPDAEGARLMLKALLTEGEAGLIDLGDVPIEGGLSKAASTLGFGSSVHRNPRGATRRALSLTDGIEAYLTGLRPSTRKAVLRDCRLFGRLDPTFRSFNSAEEVVPFLVDAAPLSMATHQASIGVTLANDEPTRAKFSELARQGRLRAYIAYVDGKPCAFAWGDLSHGVLYFRMTGYDPAFRKHCAGTAMLFHMLRQLGEDPACQRFDFGVRDMDYKERFGTIVIPSATLSIARLTSPAAFVTMMLERMLDGLKAAGASLLGGGRLSKIRRVMRR